MTEKCNGLSIKDNMKNIIAKYCTIRGLSRNEISNFWDCVILTTADEEQTKLYKCIIENKIANNQFPRNVPYFVFADPPGPKIGSGGSVLYSLHNMYKTLEDDLYTKKVLFICVGGQSQRLPTGTFLGKLSLNFPLDNCHFDMFDLKIAMYLPFVEKMNPGVFVTCSDDVETFSLPVDAQWSFRKDGFTALGHLSSTEIGIIFDFFKIDNIKFIYILGRHHGVYVLNLEDKNLNDSVITSKCYQVLQKPSFEEMLNSGAVLKDGRVCTDSVFFFDHEISRKFIDYMRDGKLICTEIDAYKDFLQPLGERPLHIKEDANPMSKDLYQILRGTNLNVILLTNSNFYHLGTMIEYLDNMTATSNNCDEFYNEMDFKFSSHALVDASFDSLIVKPTVMFSIIKSGVQLKPNTVIEWCRISPSVSIGSKCILSHCDIMPISNQQITVIPDYCCLHSVAINLNDQSIKYVTIAFHIYDNIKTAFKGNEWKAELKYMNVPLNVVCKSVGIKVDHLFENESNVYSLWKAKLFPVAESMAESFQLTLEMVKCIMSKNEISIKLSERQLLSLENIVKVKCITSMLKFEQQIRREVISAV